MRKYINKFVNFYTWAVMTPLMLLLVWPWQLSGPIEPEWYWWSLFILFFIAGPPYNIGMAIYRYRDRFGFLRGWRGYCVPRKIDGWGFHGCRVMNEGYFLIEWPYRFRQIIWRLPRNTYTRGIHGGICFDELWPRAWVSIEGNRVKSDRGTKGRFMLASLHIYFPWRGRPFGKVSAGYYPQNDSWGGKPC